MNHTDLSLLRDFVARINSTFQTDGRLWIERLPSVLAEFERRWSLTIHAPFPNLSYNYVAPATLPAGTQAVFKAGVPRDELTREVEALRFCNGSGLVRLLRAEPENGVMLLERLQPGYLLSEESDDEEATRVAAGVMRRIWRPLPVDHPFRPVEEWAAGLARLRQRFDGGTDPLPASLVDRAEGLFADLLASAGERVLLHGDLHHENILRAGDGWLAIDPKGMAGEAAYEVGPLFWNPIGIHRRPDLERVQARRVAVLSEELDIDRQRIVGYGVVQSVLSAWWTIEDGGDDWQPAIRCAESLVPLLHK